ncbi:MAG: glycosyltransferase family 9 protein [Proteobacteria bacterium]|nr:glycosyltransferase family 9 protein [Pseudomonadota bacterium]
MDFERILIIRLSALGDVVHTLAFVNRLKKARPQAHITWILQPLTFDLVKYQKNVDRFVVYDRKGGLKSLKHIAGELNGEIFDRVFMLQVSLKASLISLCARGAVKLGFDFRRSREFQWLFSSCRIPHHPPGHVLDQFFEFLDDQKIPDCPLDWNIDFTEEELAYKEGFFKTIERPVVSFVIASSNKEKDWNAEGYAQVIDEVDTRLNLQPMIVGGPSAWERELTDRIIQLCRTRPLIALEKPVRHTLLQLAGSDVVVAPDTGPMHMAVALNVPTVALYGYSDPRRCGPYGRFQDLLIDKYNLPGEGEKKITRKTKKGRTHQIRPQEVIEKIEYALRMYPRPQGR